jgi:hypothetical protein
LCKRKEEETLSKGNKKRHIKTKIRKNHDNKENEKKLLPEGKGARMVEETMFPFASMNDKRETREPVVMEESRNLSYALCPGLLVSPTFLCLLLLALMKHKKNSKYLWL